VVIALAVAHILRSVPHGFRLYIFAQRTAGAAGVNTSIRSPGGSAGRPMTAGKLAPEMKQLRKDGISKRAIAKQLGVSRTSVIRLLRSRKLS